jgi:hypothetical protein
MEGVFSAAFIMAANSWPQNPLLSAASASSTPRGSRLGEDHPALAVHQNPPVHGRREHPEHLAAGRAGCGSPVQRVPAGDPPRSDVVARDGEPPAALEHSLGALVGVELGLEPEASFG